MRFRILACVTLATSLTAAAGTLILKRAWVEKFKDRATIDASFTVDHAHKRANSAAADGDMHVAGRAPKEVGLPMVAEMANAGQASQKKAFDLIHENEGTGNFVPISGAWRLWFEHPGDSQTQFADVPVAGNTNPDHSFEIHPVTTFNGATVTQSFAFIPGFDAKDPAKAFASYNKLSITLRASATAVTLVSPRSGFNYTHFRMHLTGSPTKLQDGGLAVFADVQDDGAEAGDGEDVLAKQIRMIFVPGTVPHAAVQGKGDGDEFVALGIPRVNLNAISAFIQVSGTAQFTGKLPYEMIIVAMK